MTSLAVCWSPVSVEFEIGITHTHWLSLEYHLATKTRPLSIGWSRGTLVCHGYIYGYFGASYCSESCCGPRLMWTFSVSSIVLHLKWNKREVNKKKGYQFHLYIPNRTFPSGQTVSSHYRPSSETSFTLRATIGPHGETPFGYKGAQWLSGRVLDSRPRGRGFEPHRRHCVVVLEQDTFILA